MRGAAGRAGVMACLVTLTGEGFCHVNSWRPASRLSEWSRLVTYSLSLMMTVPYVMRWSASASSSSVLMMLARNAGFSMGSPDHVSILSDHA